VRPGVGLGALGLGLLERQGAVVIDLGGAAVATVIATLVATTRTTTVITTLVATTRTTTVIATLVATTRTTTVITTLVATTVVATLVATAGTATVVTTLVAATVVATLVATAGTATVVTTLVAATVGIALDAPTLVAIASGRVGHAGGAVTHRSLAALEAGSLIMGTVHVSLLARVRDPTLRSVVPVFAVRGVTPVGLTGGVALAAAVTTGRAAAVVAAVAAVIAAVGAVAATGVAARVTTRATSGVAASGVGTPGGGLAARVLAVPTGGPLGARTLGVLAGLGARGTLGRGLRAVGLAAVVGLLRGLLGLELLGSGPAGLLGPGCLLGHG